MQIQQEIFTSIDGEKISVGGNQSKPTLINLWFIQCPGCIAEMPALNRLKEKYEDKVNFVSLPFEQEDDVRKFLKKRKFNFTPIVNVQDFINKIGSYPYPENIFVDKNGYITHIEGPLPSHLDMSVSQTFDYYRPLKIGYRSDSTQTEKGVRYQYKTIANGILNSLEANSFKLFNTIAKHLRITVFNGDNQPLTITGFNVKGYEHQLTARFTKNADYILVYGNELDRQPSYDIKKFVTKIPKELTALTVKNEIEITKTKVRKIAPLFENDFWLWGIIGVVILVLGGFTLKMLKKA